MKKLLALGLSLLLVGSTFTGVYANDDIAAEAKRQESTERRHSVPLLAELNGETYRVIVEDDGLTRPILIGRNIDTLIMWAEDLAICPITAAGTSLESIERRMLKSEMASVISRELEMLKASGDYTQKVLDAYAFIIQILMRRS